MWTEERTDLLKRLWQDGLSAGQIAGELGDVTRDAVIGKIHRLGLSGRGQPLSTIQRWRKKQKRPAEGFQASSAAAATAEPSAMPPKLASVAPAAPKRLALEALSERTCKWPIGAPGKSGFCFCGCDAEAGIPYCAYHATVAYVGRTA
ncbi:GcrA family cell cycle regulator [Afifella pfennigii]|uniref:GcrA family cell cycle regulator n=1 Tax=Afifella pfennigii TaxID=209897 RepID=UPI00055003E3|nr:GcrA family cell cycle regulator [Afifella pfennigii]